MDPIGAVNIKKDSTIAMLEEAQQRNYIIFYMQPADLYWQAGQAMAKVTPVILSLTDMPWYQLGEAQEIALQELDVILMRKDPPFDMDYIYATYLLEMAQSSGTLVINHPQSLRDANEKLFTCQFPQCMPATLISCNALRIRQFIQEQQRAILKPLDGMGGASIFLVGKDDPNTNVILETMTRNNTRQIMTQQYIPEISQGDKRILLINGEAVPYALARIPGNDDHRGNLAAGGSGEGIALSERDKWICEQIAPTLKAKGLMFVGIDVIGDYLTEINVTSPTCIRELDALYDLNISGMLFDSIELKLKH